MTKALKLQPLTLRRSAVLYPTKARPTIDDVARRAGVSPAAVSFAVNDRPGVGAETRARILRAAEDLGWRPSAHARALTDARARAVGLVLARDPGDLETDAFFVRFLAGLERALSPRDHALLLQLVPAAEAGAYARLAASGRVDGFVLTDVERDDPRVAVLEAAGLPAVVAGRPARTARSRGSRRSTVPAWPPSPSTSPPAATTGSRSSAGRRGSTTSRPARTTGERRCSRPGASPGRWCSPRPASRRGATASRALATGATAVAATSDVLAVSLVAAARAAGRRVPDDLAVTGFDDSPLAAHGVPPLTSVRVDYAEFGAAAAGALLRLLDGEDPEPGRLSAPELVVRASS